MQEIPDKSIDLVITDPPYGIGISENGRVGSGAKSKKWSSGGSRDYGDQIWDSSKISKGYFEEIKRISNNQIIFGGNHYASILGDIGGWIVWDKGNNNPSMSDCELAWTSFGVTVKLFKYLWAGFRLEAGEIDERVHPTQKPVKLFEWIIKNYAKEGDTICDPFFGSGSCLVAAVRMGHQFIGFEKEQSYFDAAQIRIKKAQEQGKIGTWFE
jgi:site-specific DNA-methyltransferase (adenine-specific)